MTSATTTATTTATIPEGPSTGAPFHTIALAEDGWAVDILDQTLLPHREVTVRMETLEDAAHAIFSMQVRGAPLIGATAAYGMALAMHADASDDNLDAAAKTLVATRPTAVNLAWAVDEMRRVLGSLGANARREAAYVRATEIAAEDIAINHGIGTSGLPLLEEIAASKTGGERVNVLTHCNAGILATVGWGTATAPIYLAHEKGLDVHVWVDETRPRNQGASLTAWELGRHGVPHTVIADNTGGHLMQQGQVDICITGTDRTAANGDVANKIGTYLKALAAQDNGVPFYVALPSPTIDWTITDGIKDIPIEQRAAEEVSWISGRTEAGEVERVCLVPADTAVANYAFDVTPARLVTGLITERGIAEASRGGLAKLFPEYGKA
jgi:methylthioribose-1-phosphate isomerase